MASTDAEQAAVATEAGASAPAPAAAPAAAPAPDVDTESLVQGLVREWLVKNGHKDVLRVYDAERTKPPVAIKSRTQLIRGLGPQGIKLAKKNKEKAVPYPTTLDLLSAVCFKDELHAAMKRKRAAEPPAAAPPRPATAPSRAPAAAPAPPALAAPAAPAPAPAAPIPSPAAPAPAPAPALASSKYAALGSDASAAAAPKPRLAAIGSDSGGARSKYAAVGSDSAPKSKYAALGSDSAPKSKYAALGSDSAPKSKYAALGSDSAPKSKYAALGSDSGASRSKYAALGSDGGAAAAPAPAALPFTAPDGKKFATRSEMRSYVFKTFYTFTDRTNEQGLMKKPGDIDGQPFNLTDLDGCEVMLLDHMNQVQVDEVKNSKLFIGPSCESVFIRDCSNCVITVACKQLRTRDCFDCVFYLYSLTDPIIETSTRCQFAPFNGAYPGIADHFRKAYLEPDNNHWKNVFDFNKDEDSDRLPKPHWTLLEESSWTDWHVAVDGVAPDPNPVSKTAAAPPEMGVAGSMAFDIRTTTQEAAEAAMQAAEEAAAPAAAPAPASAPAPAPAPAPAVAAAPAPAASPYAAIGSDSAAAAPKPQFAAIGSDSGGARNKYAAVGSDSAGAAPKSKYAALGSDSGAGRSKYAALGSDSGADRSKYAALGSDSAPKSKYAALGSDSAPKSKYAALGSDSGASRSKYAALGSDGGAAAAPAPASLPFTAPDGKKFATRSEMRSYVFKTFYTFTDRTNEQGLMKKPGDIDGQPFNVTTLDGCEVMLLDHMDQVQVDDVKNSKLFIGPSCESVFIRDCSNCVITVACKQLRTRDCFDCVFYLYSLTDPIIETSTRCQFAPFNGAYPGIADHFRKAYLEPDNNHWKNVFDFNEDEDSDRLPKPHWTLLEESSWTDWHVAVDGVAPDPNPVSKTAAAPAAKAIGGSMAFDIRHTTQAAAEAALEAAEEAAAAQEPLADAEPAPAPVAAPAPAHAPVPLSVPALAPAAAGLAPLGHPGSLKPPTSHGGRPLAPLGALRSAPRARAPPTVAAPLAPPAPAAAVPPPQPAASISVGAGSAVAPAELPAQATAEQAEAAPTAAPAVDADEALMASILDEFDM